MRGERKSYVIVHEILPTMTSLIVASFLGAALYAVLIAAGLQFIGLGDPNSQSWGTMLYWAREQRGARRRDAATGRSCPASASRSSARRSRSSTTRSTRSAARRCALRKLDRQRRRTRAGAEVVPVAAAGRDEHPRGRGTSPSPTPPSTGPVVAVDDVELRARQGRVPRRSSASRAAASRRSLYAIARLLGAPLAGEITNGQVLFKGRDMVTLADKQLRAHPLARLLGRDAERDERAQPGADVGAQMRDACEAHSTMSKRQIEGRSKEVLRLVSIDPVHLLSYPHQLSGGMRQRAMIAMALLFTPELIVMDEPTSALDVVGQRSLMVQIKELQEQLGFAVIFVTHDMSLVRHFSDRLLVMYAAQVAELGRTRQLFDKPLHPYTQGLLEAFPSIHGAKERPARDPGLAAGPAASAGRLPLRAALPARVRALPRTSAARCSRSTASSSAASCTSTACRAGRGRGRRASMSEPLLRAEGLTRHFTVGKLISRQTPARRRRRQTSSIGQRRDRRARRRERQRQEHDRPPPRARLQADARARSTSRAEPVSRLRTRRQRLAYSSDVAMVFQDPYSSINPAYRVSHPIERGIMLHRRELAGGGAASEVERVLGRGRARPGRPRWREVPARAERRPAPARRASRRRSPSSRS